MADGAGLAALHASASLGDEECERALVDCERELNRRSKVEETLETNEAMAAYEEADASVREARKLVLEWTSRLDDRIARRKEAAKHLRALLGKVESS